MCEMELEHLNLTHETFEHQLAMGCLNIHGTFKLMSLAFQHPLHGCPNVGSILFGKFDFKNLSIYSPMVLI